MEVWNHLIPLADKIENLFDSNFKKEDEFYLFENWIDMTWSSEHIRKCHLKIIDNRETQKMWLMHVNIFPETHINAPILGFDVVSGKNKITGSFFDFSPVIKEPHFYTDHVKNMVKDLEWSKPRELPEWAMNIFSENMIAVGNLKEETEIEQLTGICYSLIEYYVDNIMKNTGTSKTESIIDGQNYYCQQQKLNPHLHRSILSMGISDEDKDLYVNNILFKEI